MALVTITPANVRPDTTKGLGRGLAASAIIAGELISQDPTTFLWSKFDADAAAASASSLVLAIAMNSAPGANQPVEYQSDDGAQITAGGTLVAGTAYWASGTAGQYQDAAPDTGDNAVFVGVAKTAALLALCLRNFAVAAP